MTLRGAYDEAMVAAGVAAACRTPDRTPTGADQGPVAALPRFWYLGRPVQLCRAE